MPLRVITERAQQLAEQLQAFGNPRLAQQVLDLTSKAGGGALPLLDLPTKGVAVKIQGLSANAIERTLRRQDIPIIGRIEDDAFIMDLRTVQIDELTLIVDAFKALLERSPM